MESTVELGENDIQKLGEPGFYLTADHNDDHLEIRENVCVLLDIVESRQLDNVEQCVLLDGADD